MTFGDSLEEITRKLKELDTQREQEIKWIQGKGAYETIGNVDVPLPEDVKYQKLKTIEREIDHLRQLYISKFNTIVIIRFLLCFSSFEVTFRNFNQLLKLRRAFWLVRLKVYRVCARFYDFSSTFLKFRLVGLLL